MQLSHGPQLPYRTLVGIVPCGTRWLGASAKLQGATVSVEPPRLFDTFADVLDERPSFSTIALRAPVGYLDKPEAGGRTCDREARQLLGPRRGASVRSAPTWETFEHPDAVPNGLDGATMVLLPRYREVAAEMAPYRQRTVFEAHPELTFYDLNHGIPLRYSKRLRAGRDERRALLAPKFQGVERILDAQIPSVSPAHLLDATACLWSARRIAVRSAIRMPADPEWDSQGLRMEFVR